MTKLVDESALSTSMTLQKGYIDAQVSTVASDLSAEVSARTSADSALQDSIGAEATTARAAEEANASGISTLNTSVSSIQATVTALQDTVDDLTSGTVKSVQLDKVNDLEYTLTVDDTSYSLNIPEDQFLKDVAYDSANTQLVFTFKTTEGESVVKVDVSDLVDIYTNSDGSLTIKDNVIGHANSVTAGTTSSTATGTLAHGGSFIVPTVTFDKFGHITATGSTTQTLPSETALSKGTEATATATLAHGGTFNAYTAFTVSGHTITPTLTTFTMPAQATLADLGGIGTVTASGDGNLTLNATSSGTTVTISGAVNLSGYYTQDEVDALIDGTQDAQADDWEELD